MELIARKGSQGKVERVRLKPGGVIHFIGIAGTAMAGMAGVLKSKGFNVQGSDENVYPPMSGQLEKTNIPFKRGYSRKNIHDKLSLVIVGNSISAQNKEALELVQSGVPYVSLPEMIRSALIEGKKSIVVSGTHGKTTTSAMTAWLAGVCGKNPDFLIGGIPRNFETSFTSGSKGSWFVIEGDEYDTAFFDKRPKFIHYQPSCLILTSIEFDHVDIYENLEKVKDSFELLVRSLPQNGILVVHSEDKNIQDILKKASCEKIITYGAARGDYFLEDRTALAQSSSLNSSQKTKINFQQFSVRTPKGEKVRIRLPLFGLHNAMNALGVFALCDQLGWEREKILKGFETFKGVQRRFQILFENERAVLVEDFAHHPTAALAVISALRERYPGCKIIVVFEPRSASSRRNVFQKQYAKAFSKADCVFAAPPFREDEIKKEERFSSKGLIKELNLMGVTAQFHQDADEMAQAVVKTAENKSVIVVMSNGPFAGIHQKIKKLLL